MEEDFSWSIRNLTLVAKHSARVQEDVQVAKSGGREKKERERGNREKGERGREGRE